jgi:hypothetical protein
MYKLLMFGIFVLLMCGLVSYSTKAHEYNKSYCKEQTQRSYDDCMIMMGE